MYALKWTDAVLDALALYYIRLPVTAREQLAGAVERLNARLKTRPFDEGELRSGGYRVTFVVGLAVTFHIDPLADLVTVVELRGTTR